MYRITVLSYYSCKYVFKGFSFLTLRYLLLIYLILAPEFLGCQKFYQEIVNLNLNHLTTIHIQHSKEHHWLSFLGSYYCIPCQSKWQTLELKHVYRIRQLGISYYHILLPLIIALFSYHSATVCSCCHCAVMRNLEVKVQWSDREVLI